jgi:hypothetical protein
LKILTDRLSGILLALSIEEGRRRALLLTSSVLRSERMLCD